MKDQDWIVIKYDKKPEVILCERCGATAQIPMPISHKQLTAICNPFSKEHSECSPQQCPHCDKELVAPGDTLTSPDKSFTSPLFLCADCDQGFCLIEGNLFPAPRVN